MNYQTFKITSKFAVVAVDASRKMELSDDDRRLVESIWESELKRSQGHLFNGKLLSMLTWDDLHLVGEFVEYKYYIAQLRAPELKNKLQIRPVSISGMTYAADKILIGLRSETVFQHPLWYELAPSGGVDAGMVSEGRVDILKQFEIELIEETGLQPSDIQSIDPFALIYDEQSHSFEIGAAIQIQPVRAGISAASDEYVRFFWIAEKDLSPFIAQHRSKIIPLSLHLLSLKGYSF